MKTKIPPLPDTAISSCRQLHRMIAQEIAKGDNWIPFSRFMELALYAPRFGYYTGTSRQIGGKGDFITAPTLTPLFSRALSAQLADLLPQTAGNLYEFGAGTGNLAVEVAKCLSDGLNRYYIIELSGELAQRQRKTVSEKLPPHLAEKVVHLTEIPVQFDGIIIGNEVLDAMPVERIYQDASGFHRVGVSLDDGRLKEALRPLTEPGLLLCAQTYFPLDTPNQAYLSELHPIQSAFVRTLAEKLVRGAMIWIDYGFDAAQYYHPQRHMGTLIGHHRHHVVHDPFFRIGLTDLTAHVNFTEIAQAATDAGLDLIGYTTQSHFLLNAGITDLLAQTGSADSPSYLKEAAAVQKLIGAHEMGELFKVMALGKNVGTDWRGFDYGDICHKL